MEDLPLGRTAFFVPEFVVEDLPLGRTIYLVPEFVVEDLPLGRTADLVPEFSVNTVMVMNYCIITYLLGLVSGIIFIQLVILYNVVIVEGNLWW